MDVTAAHRALASAVVPRDRSPELARYYEQCDAKHHTCATGGSTFTDLTLTRIEDVVALTATQRGDLAGDDRGAFIAAGANPDAFRDDARYLLVRTPGVLGAVRAATLDPSTPVQIVQDKDGVPAAVVADVPAQPTIAFGTVILVKDEGGADMVITAFPGAPEPPREFGPLDALAGQQMTLGEATVIIGHDQYAVMTRAAT